MDFESVKSYLSKHLDSNGSSIYDHIAKLTRKIVEEKPENAFDIFENISLMVKNQNNNNNEDNDIQTINIDEKEKNEIQTYINSILSLYGKKKEKQIDEQENEDEEENEEENEEEKIDKTKCANILQYSQLFQWSGISLNYEEMYQLQNNFISLIQKFPNIQTCRFWGIIQAINNNYWIVETKLEEYPEKELTDDKQEQSGKGINEYVYFVTTNIENCEWIQLNDISPEQIKKSRQISCLFTGNLESEVNCRTYFKWNESVLLRCQIARITSSTMLSPNEYYQKPEEENEENPFEIEENEEFTHLSFDDAINYESWIHSRPHLRLEGRVQKWVKPEEEEEDDDDDDNKNDEEKEPTEEELEEEIPVLQSISSDKNKMVQENEEDDDDDNNNSNNCWYMRSFNQNIGKFEIVCICNKLWNGAKTIYLCNSKQFVNIYVGNGIKYNDQYYTPAPPLNIQSQFNEFKPKEDENDDDNDNENNNQEDENDQKEQEIKKESMFVVQQEQMPPPPPPAENDENENNDENQNEETEQE